MRHVAAIAVVAACGKPAWPPPAPAPAVTVSVIAQASGDATDDVERYLAMPLEVGVSGAPGLLGSRSLVEPGQVMLWLDFDGGDPFAARQAVIERLEHVSLPSGVQAGLGRMSSEPVALRFLVRGPAMAARTYADWTVERTLKQIPGVVDVDSRGGQEERVDIQLDPDRLAAFGLAPAAVVSAVGRSALDAENSSSGGFTVRGAYLPLDPVAIAELAVADRNGGVVRVKDVAAVARDAAPLVCDIADRQGPVVEGIVWARSRDDVDKLRDPVSDALAKLSAAAPPGVSIEPIADAGATVVVLRAAPLADQLRAAAAIGTAARAVAPDAVTELCRPIGFAPELPDELRVLSTAEPDRVAAALAQVPDVQVVPSGAPVWIRIDGNDPATVRALVDTVVARLSRIPGVVLAGRFGDATALHRTFRPDRAQLERLGLDTSAVGGALALLGAGVEVADAADGERLVPIVVRMPADTSLDHVFVAGAGGLVPVAAAVAVTTEPEPRAILRAGGVRYTALRVYATSDDARAGLHEALDGIAVPPACRMRVSGAR